MMYTKDTTLRQKGCKTGCAGHPFIGRQIPKMLCGRRMPDQSSVRGMHTIRTFLRQICMPHLAAGQLLNCSILPALTKFPLSGSVGTR